MNFYSRFQFAQQVVEDVLVALQLQYAVGLA